LPITHASLLLSRHDHVQYRQAGLSGLTLTKAPFQAGHPDGKVTARRL
jgi:hypothetical protein